MSSDAPNIGPVSTTFAWKHVKVSTAPQAQSTAAARRRRWKGLARFPLGEKVQLCVSYRGGAQCWILVEARGRSGIFPGDAQIIDVLQEICQNV